MSVQPKPQKASEFIDPRKEPLRYPGKRPKNSFIIHNETVYPIVFDSKDIGSVGSTFSGRVIIDGQGNYLTIDDFLTQKKVAPLKERFPVLGYGSNPVPGQLISKFGNDTIVPLVFGDMDKSDVAYNLISNTGYVFAELILGQEGVKNKVGITFLDEKQLERMIETEPNYKLAFAPNNVCLDSEENLFGGPDSAAYLFAGFRKVWVPIGYDEPIAIKELPSKGRKLTALTQEQTLSLIIEQFGEKLNFSELGITQPIELANYLRAQKNIGENPGKLKYDLQQLVSQDTRSLSPLSEQVTVVNGKPTNVFADNHN